MKQFVVKVQRSLASNTGIRSVLLYDHSREIIWEGTECSELKQLMPLDQVRVFLWAQMEGTLVSLLRPATEAEFEEHPFRPGY